MTHDDRLSEVLALLQPLADEVVIPGILDSLAKFAIDAHCRVDEQIDEAEPGIPAPSTAERIPHATAVRYTRKYLSRYPEWHTDQVRSLQMLIAHLRPSPALEALQAMLNVLIAAGQPAATLVPRLIGAPQDTQPPVPLSDVEPQ